MRAAFLSLALLGFATPAQAGDVVVEVRDASGRAVRDAVVMIKSARPVSPGAPARLSGPAVMAQQDIQFAPQLLIVPVGSTVSFPNRDKVRHHVYSFSAAKRFELKLYGRDETRSVTFDKPGAVALGCNIHDAMIAYIYVTDTPFAARSGADGAAAVRDTPAGAATLLVWHPQLKARGAVSRPLTVSAGPQRLTVAVDLRPSAR